MISRQHSFLRLALERVSRNVVLRRRLPSRVGGQYIYVSPDSALKFWKYDLDQVDSALFDWAAEFVKPGQVVWDIGANVGLFTFAAASLSGKEGYVLAVEPDPTLVELLRRSIQEKPAQAARVIVLPVAVSEEVSVAQLAVASRGRCASHLTRVPGSSQTGGSRETLEVITVTLDWLLDRFPAPNVIKIDVEGAEHYVLEGSRNALATKPIVLCEVHASNTQRVATILKKNGYTMFDLGTNSTQRSAIELPVFNTLAIPNP